MKPRLLFYCQHVLGMGHFVRSTEIVRALDDWDVCFLNGGEIVPGFELPPRVDVINLPPIAADAEFRELHVAGDAGSLDEVKQQRTTRILSEFERLQPDVVVIELFPFGRRKFAFELLPLLEHIRSSAPGTKVVCSLRDILVGKGDQARYEERACRTINRYFDLLLIHADPRLQRLDETFGRATDIACPIRYTGFVAQAQARPAQSVARSDEPTIVASVGGGRVGYELLESVVAASRLLDRLPHRLRVFCGPYMPAAQVQQLQALAAPHSNITVEHYTTHFCDELSAAELSISMAGYNTCMNLLTTGVRALVYPFTGSGDQEQTIRARKLSRLGVVGVVEPHDLAPPRLAGLIRERLSSVRPAVALDTGGVTQTGRLLRELVGASPVPTKPSAVPVGAGLAPAHATPHAPTVSTSMQQIIARLRPVLQRRQAAQQTVDIFARDDDVDVDEAPLRRLLHVFGTHDVPLNLAVIPGSLSGAAIELLLQHCARPGAIELHQHGWRHTNHEQAGRKCEFGAGRSFEQQLEDVARGKARMEQAFGPSWFAAFTPPWNRCTTATLDALDALGFRVLSRDRDKLPVVGYTFRELSTTLDLYRWHNGAAMKAPDEIVDALIEQLRGNESIGLLLHHKVMDAAACSFVALLLDELRRYPVVRWHTLQSLLSVTEFAYG